MTLQVNDKQAQSFGVVPLSIWQAAAPASGIVNSIAAVTLAPAVVGFSNYLSSLNISTDTLGAATELAIRDGAGGTVLWRMKLQTAALPHALIIFSTPLKGTTGNLLELVTLTASVTGGVYVNAQGYVGV